MKKLLLTLFILFISLPSSALMLQGNAQFNEEAIREETFSNINLVLDPNEIKNYLVDPNYAVNNLALAQGTSKIGNRVLSLFSDGSYGLRYTNDPYHNYYYKIDGTLLKVDVLNKPFYVYPHRSVAYNKYGVFKNATYVISKHEQYLYDSEQNLMGHWLDDSCYDKDGNVLMQRKTLD